MSRVELLADGLYFGEGPRWHDGLLWISDFYDHAVKTISLDGEVREIVVVPNQPSGLGWLPDGRLLVVSMIDRRLMRLDPDGLVVHADLSSVATFHCNDMVVDTSGRAYVGNFGFDLDHAFATRGAKSVFAEHDTAVLAMVDPDGSVHVASTDMEFPNGCVITPDGLTMIIAETMAARLTAFDIAADGSLNNRRVWAQLPPRTAPDGICLDAAGRVWVANPSGANCLLVSDGGEIIDTVDLDQPCLACALGGEDGRTLFLVTADSSTHQVASASRTGKVSTTRVDVPGAGW